TFAPDAKSLWFASWQDKPGASAQAAVRDTSLPPPGTDRILRLDAPFTGQPVEVAQAEFPLEGLPVTADRARLLARAGYEPRRVLRDGWIDAKNPAKRGVLVFRSTEGVYDDPGTIAMHAGRHADVVWVTPDGKGFYRFGDGFRA